VRDPINHISATRPLAAVDDELIYHLFQLTPSSAGVQFRGYLNDTVSTSTAHGASHLNGRKVKRCGSTLNNIIEVIAMGEYFVKHTLSNLAN